MNDVFCEEKWEYEDAGLGGVSNEFPLAGVSGCFRGCPGLSVDRVGTKKHHLH
jgi:hypothetical protein